MSFRSKPWVTIIAHFTILYLVKLEGIFVMLHISLSFPLDSCGPPKSPPLSYTSSSPSPFFSFPFPSLFLHLPSLFSVAAPQPLHFLLSLAHTHHPSSFLLPFSPISDTVIEAVRDRERESYREDETLRSWEMQGPTDWREENWGFGPWGFGIWE
jgi:hypothetical protein